MNALVAAGLFIVVAFPVTPSPRPASNCGCNFVVNTFPNYLAEGTLTETIGCSSTSTHCTIAGDVIWEPAEQCSPVGNWSTSYSHSIDIDYPATPIQYFINCNPSTVRAHYHTVSTNDCSGSTPLAVVGKIKNASDVLIGDAAKTYSCVTVP